MIDKSSPTEINTCLDVPEKLKNVKPRMWWCRLICCRVLKLGAKIQSNWIIFGYVLVLI